MAESLCCPPETITLLIGYTPIQNKKLKKKIEQRKGGSGCECVGPLAFHGGLGRLSGLRGYPDEPVLSGGHHRGHVVSMSCGVHVMGGPLAMKSLTLDRLLTTLCLSSPPFQCRRSQCWEGNEVHKKLLAQSKSY